MEILPEHQPNEIYIDNAAATRIYNDQNFRRVRHMEIYYLYSIQEVEAFNARLNHIDTLDMTADLNTKVLPIQLHYRHLRKIFSNVDEIILPAQHNSTT
jgi:hypothetical protein